MGRRYDLERGKLRTGVCWHTLILSGSSIKKDMDEMGTGDLDQLKDSGVLYVSVPRQGYIIT